MTEWGIGLVVFLFVAPAVVILCEMERREFYRRGKEKGWSETKIARKWLRRNSWGWFD